MASSTESPSTDVILKTTRTLQAWQRSRIDAVQTIFEKTLESVTSRSDVNLNALPQELDKLLFDKLNLLTNETPSSNTTLNPTESEDEEEVSSTSNSRNESVPTVPINSSTTPRARQARIINQEPNATYSCYTDKNNGVMACNGDELVYIDWVLSRDKSASNYVVQIVDTTTPNPRHDNRSKRNRAGPKCPAEFQNTFVVDMDYAPSISKYVIGIVERYEQNDESPGNRKSFLYLFDSTDGTFERYESACDAIDRRGLITHLCCCANHPVIYLLMNNRSESDLIILNNDGTLFDQKTSEDLPLPRLDTRLVDIACTTNNDRLALAFNESTKKLAGQTGVYLINPQDWTRIGLIDLKKTNIPFILPRLTWIDSQSSFAIIDENGKLVLFNADGITTSTLDFVCRVPGQGDHVYPTNVCASQNQWIAVRYERVITIHQVLN